LEDVQYCRREGRQGQHVGPTRNFQRRTAMPVILLWAVPAVFVLGGVTYLIVK
jgi:hypothetical protein